MTAALRWNGWMVLLFLIAWFFVASARHYFAISLPPDADLLPDGARESILARQPWMQLHVVGAMIGLIVGPGQFLLRRVTPPERAERWLPVHRWLGRTYLVSAAFAGIGGLYLSAFALGGFAASAGFRTLAAMFLGATTVAYIRIRAGNEASHREWMTRSYALMISIMLMRISLPSFPSRESTSRLRMPL